MEFLESCSCGSDCIDIRCLQDRMPGATQPIGAVLVSHDEEEVGLLGDCGVILDAVGISNFLNDVAGITQCGNFLRAEAGIA